MGLYRIAGILTEMEPEYARLRESAAKYLEKGDGPPDVRAILPGSFAEQKKKQIPEMDDELIEYFYTGVLYSYRALDYGVFVLHGSAISCDGKAYVFSADSGTGKSTHTAYWREAFGDRVGVINDDKPAIRLERNGFDVYGTPFSGKTSLNENVSFPLGALCFIYRSEHNEIRRIGPDEAVPLLLKQTLRPANESKLDKALSLADEFLRRVPVYSLGVTNSVSSAIFAEKALIRDQGGAERDQN